MYTHSKLIYTHLMQEGGAEFITVSHMREGGQGLFSRHLPLEQLSTNNTLFPK